MQFRVRKNPGRHDNRDYDNDNAEGYDATISSDPPTLAGSHVASAMLEDARTGEKYFHSNDSGLQECTWLHATGNQVQLLVIGSEADAPVASRYVYRNR